MSTEPLSRMRLRRRERLNTPREIALRKRRVDQVVNIIGNAASRADVEAAIILYDTYFPSRKPPGQYVIWNTKQKKAAEQMAVALRRLRDKLNSSDLIFELKRDFPLDKSDLETWYIEVQKIAATKLPKRILNNFKRHAVRSAAQFLKQRGVPLTKARNGKFCRVASAFYRYKPGANLYHYCREFLKGQI